jgi:hypothetical protein
MDGHVWERLSVNVKVWSQGTNFYYLDIHGRIILEWILNKHVRGIAQNMHQRRSF